MRRRWCQDKWTQLRLGQKPRQLFPEELKQKSHGGWWTRWQLWESSFFTFFHLLSVGGLCHLVRKNRHVLSGIMTGFLKCRQSPPSSGNGYMCQDGRVDSKSTREHWKQHNLKVNPDGVVPQDAAGLNSSYCRVVVTHSQRLMSLEISSSPRKHLELDTDVERSEF